MLSSLRNNRAVSLFFFIVLILTFVSRPALSHTITALQRVIDRSHLTSSPYQMGDTLIIFGIALLAAIVGTLTWIMNRITIERYVTRISRFLATQIDIAQQLSYYLRFDTLLSVAAPTIIDANNTDVPTSTRPMLGGGGGLTYPVSSIPRDRTAQYHLVRLGAPSTQWDGRRTEDFSFGPNSIV